MNGQGRGRMCRSLPKQSNKLEMGMRDLRFPQGCFWGYRVSGAWSCLVGRVLPELSKDFTDYTFTGQAVQKEFLDCLAMLPCTLRYATRE